MQTKSVCSQKEIEGGWCKDESWREPREGQGMDNNGRTLFQQEC